MPVLDAALVAQRLGVTERVARTALKSLAAVGIVEPVGGRRNRRYVVPEMVGVLRRATPEGGLPRPDHYDQSPRPDKMPATEPLPPEPPACNHRGPRANRPCHLPPGHKGQHRYPPTP